MGGRHGRRVRLGGKGAPTVSRRAMRGWCALLLLTTVACRGWAQDGQSNLPGQTLEQLMQIQVTSASKKAEDLRKAPAAIYVITGEEIRRGGYSSVPDALRMVPGLYVVQQNAHEWLISARGFSNTFNDKMLVLIDGRSVYSPTFGGVYWDVQDPPLEDIERIEVIRGPGGTLWGANAVNGVINIITKSATKTQGPQVVTSAGADEGYAARLRYGGSAEKDFDYRLYGTSNDWLPTVDAAGAENYDGWNLSQGGVRMHWQASQNNVVTFDGEGYAGRARDTVEILSPTALPEDTDVMTALKGGHVLGRWRHRYSERSSSELLGYCDWNDRAAVIYSDYRTTCDVEWQQNYAISNRQNLTAGASVTTTGDDWPATFTLSFTQPSNRFTTVGEFVQYDVAVVPDKLRVVAGSKFDYNNYTDFEVQPQIRAAWTPTESSTLWGAISRAVRTPARIDETIRVHAGEINPAPPPLEFLLIEGQGEAQSEALDAYEMGYRWRWRESFSLDAAAYYNAYDHLASASAPGSPVVNLSPYYIDIPEYAQELGRAETHGIEISLRYVPVQRWTIVAGITELRGSSTAATAYPAVANNPRQQFNLQSRLDVTRYLNLDSNWYHYNAIPGELALVNRADAGVSTKSIRGFTFSAWGRNLQQDRHAEAIQYIFLGGEIRRAVVIKMVWEPGEK